jgi:plastocyanin
MKTGWIRLTPLLLVLALAVVAVVGCGNGSPGASSSGGGPTVEMGQTNFVQHSITVQAGKPVHFDDTADGGGVHVLCVGTGNGGTGTSTCYQAGNAPPNTPSELLSPGLTFNIGDKKDITFPAPGTYHVICTIHQGMYIDITVR